VVVYPSDVEVSDGIIKGLFGLDAVGTPCGRIDLHYARQIDYSRCGFRIGRIGQSDRDSSDGAVFGPCLVSYPCIVPEAFSSRRGLHRDYDECN
jgi:hypothetical protein